MRARSRAEGALAGPDLDQLRALDAIDRLGSFAGAARELGRATSAISYSISMLEKALSLRLFDRTGHRAELTLAGRRVLDAGRRVLAESASLEVLARTLRDEWEPRLAVVVDGLLPMRPILGAIARFSRDGLPTHVQLRVEHLGGVRERFSELRADVMMVLDLTPDERLLSRRLAPVAMRLVVSPRHALAKMRGAKKRVTRAELAAHVELVVADSRRDATPSPGRLALGSPHVVRLSDFHTKRIALLEGAGVGWMPLHLVDDDLARRRLVRLTLESEPDPVFVPQLAWRRATTLGRAAQRFLTHLDATRERG